MEHYCYNPDTGLPCCSSDDEVKSKCKQVVLEFLFATTPSEFALNKWTSVMRSLSWFASVILIHGLLCSAWELAFRGVQKDIMKSLSTQRAQVVEDAAALAGEEATKDATMTFRVQNGKRHLKVWRWIRKPDIMPDLLSVCGCLLIAEGLLAAIAWWDFESRSSRPRNKSKESQQSALQFLVQEDGWLAKQHHAIWRSLSDTCQRPGTISHCCWRLASQLPPHLIQEALGKFHACIFKLEGGLFMRFSVHYRLQPHFHLVSLLSSKVERHAGASAFRSAPLCCQSPSFGRKVLQQSFNIPRAGQLCQ